MSKLDSDWIIFRTSADAETTPDKLVRSLIRASEFTLQDMSETISALGQFLDYCQRDEKNPVLFLDNVDHLSKETLRFIFRLTEYKDKMAYIRVVLIGSDSFLNTLKELSDEKPHESVLHSINIPSLTSQQTLEYLQYHLSSYNMDVNVFSEKEVGRIFKVSAGVPADINFLAIQGLNDPASVSLQRPKPSSGSRSVKTGVLIFAALILSFVFLLIWKASDVTEVDDKATIELALPVTASLNEGANIEETLLNEPLPDAWMEQQERQSQENDESLIVAENIVPKDVPAEVDNNVVTSPQQITIESALMSEDKETNLKSEIRGESWLSEQKDEDYVLQLIGAVEMTTIQRFVEGSGIEKGTLTLLSTRKNGQDWFVLSHGLYSGIDEARSAIATLPVSARAHKPWPNSVKKLKEALLSDN